MDKTRRQEIEARYGALRAKRSGWEQAYRDTVRETKAGSNPFRGVKLPLPGIDDVAIVLGAMTHGQD